METPQLIVLNLILLMLVFVMNVKANTEIIMNTQQNEVFIP